MANAITYIRNVGKSVKYASFDVIKELNPVFKDLAETNGELARDAYKSIKNLKYNAKKLPSSIMESEYGQFAKTFKDNLFSDLKSGKFYNRERIEEYENKAAMNFMSGDDDDFDFDNDSSDFEDLLSDDFSANDMMDLVGEKTSTAISTAVAKSAEYMVEANYETARASHKQLNAIYGGLHSGLSTINQNISKMLDFSNEAVTTHFQNSSTFYSEITRLDQERNNYLKEISEGIKQLNAPAPTAKRKDRTNTYSDLVTTNGVLDFSAYAKAVKSNIKNKTDLGMVLDMLDMMKTMGLNNSEFAASPVSMLMTGMMTKFIPNMLKESMESFNKSLSGLIGNALLGLKEKGKEYGIWGTIADIFGISTSLDDRIDPSKYEKGKIPFDGITKKAIIEVIPTYLSKILSAINNQPESRFNYDTGKFVTMEQLKQEFDDYTKQSANRAASGIDSVVRSKKSKLSFKNKAEEEQFDRDWEAIKEYMYKNQKNFNTRDKSLKGKSFGLKGGMASDINVRLLQEILDGNPEMVKYANELFREVDSQNRRMDDVRASGIFSSLVNNSSEISTKSDVKSSFIKTENTVLSELAAIHKELSYIRIYGTGGGYGSKKKGKGKVKFENFSTPISRVGKDATYDKNLEDKIKDNLNNVKDESVDAGVSRILQSGKDATLDTTKVESFSDRMHNAPTLSAKIAVLTKSASELAKKPAKFIVAMMDKADARLYDLIYGPKQDKDGKKSFAGRLFKGLEGMFNKFADFVTETIIEPLKGKFTKENVHNAAKKFFGIFGIDIDETTKKAKEFLFGKKDIDGNRTKNGLFGSFVDDFKTDMKSAFGWVKNAFKDVGDWFGVTSKKNASGKAKEAQNKATDGLKSFVSTATDIPQAYSGMKRVDKTGLAIISEGEMIIPPDMNPFNVSKRKRGEDKVRKGLKSSIDNIFGFAEGTKDASTDDSTQNKKQKFTREDYDRLPFWMRVSDEILGGAQNLFKNISENIGISEDDKTKFKNTATDFIGKVKDYGGTMAAGATIGAGVSLLTGLIGGPLVGAAVGASVGLIKKSETVQNMLFGEFKDGEYQGNLLSKELSNNIHKYLPDMSKGATVGGILAALPIIPGGPIAGVIAGSALGFAKNNDKVQEFLFGDTGLFKMSKEDFTKQVQKKLPKMGAGALIGALAGPFGLGANLILGSALGFASDTNAFKNLMFGEEIDGKREGGIFGAIVTPAKDFFQKMYGDFSSFLKEHMLQPLANTIDPIKKQLQIMGKSLTDMFANTFKEYIGRPIERLITETIVNPIGKFFGGFIKFIAKPAKLLASAPFKLIGVVGNALRTRQIKRGQADYMGAEQRNAFRRSRGWRMNIGGRDQYSDFDAALEGMSMEDISTAQDTLTALRDSRKSSKKAHYDSFNRVKKEIYSKDNKVSTDTAKLALDMLRRGSYSEAIKFVDESNIEEAAKKRILIVLRKESDKMKLADRMKSNEDETANDVSALLNKLGFDISPAMAKKIAKGDKEATKIIDTLAGEQRYRKKYKKQDETPIDSLNEDQSKRHTEIVNLLEDIANSLRVQAGIGKRLGSDKLEDIEAREALDEQLPEGNFRETANFTDKRKLAAYKLKRGGKAAIKKSRAAMGTAFTNAGQLARDIRHSSVVETVIGDGNKDWQNDVSTPINNIKNKVFKKGTESDTEQALKVMAASTTAMAEAQGINTKSLEKGKGFKSITNSARNLVKKSKSKVTQFVDGLPFTYTKDKDGNQIPEPGNADNQENMKKLEEKNKQQRTLVETIKSIPSTLGGLFGKFFGGNEDEENKSWISKLLDKIGTPAKVAAATAVSFGVMGWAQEKILPALKSFWDEKAAPYLNEAWNGRKEGFGQFIYFFNPRNENGLLAKLGKFLTVDLPAGIGKVAPTIATYISKGMNWALREILPGVVSTLVQNIPIILKSVTTGLLDGIDSLINKRKHNDGTMNSLDGVESMVTSANDPFSSMMNSGQPSWFDSSVDSGPVGASTGTTISANFGGMLGGAMNDIINTANSVNGNTATTSATSYANAAMTSSERMMAKQSTTTLNSGYTVQAYQAQISDPLRGKTPKGLEMVNSAYAKSAAEEYEKVKLNYVNTPYGKMTVGELLDSDLQMATGPDGTPIYGYEFLKYDNLAKQLGMNIRISQEEIDANTEKLGGRDRYETEKTFAKSSARALVRGLAGSDVGIKGATKVISGSSKGLAGLTKLIPGVGKAASMGIDSAGKAATKVPGGLNTFGKKINAKILSTATGEVVENVAEGAVESVTSASGTSKLGKLADAAKKNSTINKFITKAVAALDGFLKDNRVYKYLKNAADSAKGKSGKELTEAALEKFSQYLAKNIDNLLLKFGVKNGSKAVAKVTAYLLSGSTILIADAVLSFLSGMKNAKNILRITEEPSFLMTVVCGLLEALNSVFLLGLVPLEVVMDMVIGGFKLLGLNVFDELSDQRDAAQAEVDAYNKENGTNFTISEYNKKDSLWNKTKQGFSNLFGKKDKEEKKTETKKATAKADAAVLGSTVSIEAGAKVGTNIVSGAAIKASKSKKQSATSKAATKAVEAVNKKLNEVQETIGILVSPKGLKDLGEGVTKSTKTTFKHLWKGEISKAFTDKSGYLKSDNDGMNNISKTVNDTVKTTLALPGLLTAMAGFVVRNFKPVMEGVKTVGSSIGKTVGNMFKSAVSGGSISDIFSNKYDADTGNKLVDTISSVVNGVIKVPLTPVALLTSGVSSVIRGIVDFGKSIAKAGELSSQDKRIIEDSKDGKIKVFSSEYWTNHGNLSGIAGGFNTFVTTMKKVFNIPMALLGSLDLGSMGSNIVDWVKNLIKGNSSSTTTSTEQKWWQKINIFGSGSGLYVGRASDPNSENRLQKAVATSHKNESKLNTNISKDTFISQIDGRYRNKKFNISRDTESQTLGDTGCAPAAAAMAVNATLGQDKADMMSASRLALNYKVKNDGVNAAYFNDEFARHGISTNYITANDPDTKKQEILKRLHDNSKVVLMGSDINNTSKSHSPFGPNPHYVVANGLSKDGKYVYINDPESQTPNIRYDANKVLGNTQLGIIPSVARGSKLLTSKLHEYVGRGKYGTNTVQYKVWNGLRAAGYNEIATAAAMGNIQCESGFNPAVIEKGSGVGFGLVQWSYSRRTKMENYAKSKGVDPSDLNIQIEYLLKELESSSGIWTNASSKYGLGTLTRADWANGTDINKATKAFMCCFERPSYDSSKNHIDKRLQSAKEYYEAFTGTPISSSSTGASESESLMGQLYGVFGGLTEAYGLTQPSTSGDTNATNISGNVSSNTTFAEKQKALVAKMYSVQGKLKYAQNNATYPGSRNPDDGSGDCSSTVQWAYKNILGVDPGGWTGAQRTDADTYTVATSTADESKLQLGDLLLKDGHVEMYAGDGKMIGHGGGNDGKTLGPTIKSLDKTGKYNLVRRWVGFKGSGSGLLGGFIGRGSDSGYPELASYDNALRHIKPQEFKSLYPLGYNPEKLSNDKVSVMQYNDNKLSNDKSYNKSKFVGRGTIKSEPITSKTTDNMTELVKSIVQLLVQIVTNTEQLNTIVKLLGEYISTINLSDGSDSAKQTALLAKQNLINTIQSGKVNEPNAQLLRLIEATEKLARE